MVSIFTLVFPPLLDLWTVEWILFGSLGNIFSLISEIYQHAGGLLAAEGNC